MKKTHLSSRPAQSQGLASQLEDRDLMVSFVALQELEEHSKKLYKEVGDICGPLSHPACVGSPWPESSVLEHKH